MQLFRTLLLLNTLRGIIEAIEEIDPNNAALPQLKFTAQEQNIRLAGLRADNLALSRKFA